MTKRKKITIVGAGKTGAETALMLAIKGLGDIVLLDIPESESQTKGKALDLLQATSLFGTDVLIKGTAKYEDTVDSDLVIITAGIARKPGMSRTDLIDINLNIVADSVTEIVKYSPNTVLLVLTNPVDIMTYVAYKVSGFPKQRVIGQAGILDTARFRTFIAEELDVSVKDVTAFVLGVHGDEMVPLPRYTFVNGMPLEELLPKDRIEELIERTRRGGAEIVNLLGNGSAAYAPAASLMQMAECVLLDQQRLVPAITYLEGEYGYNNLVFGVPVILGAGGIERIIQINLLPAERDALDQSAKAVKAGIEKAYKMGSRKLA